MLLCLRWGDGESVPTVQWQCSSCGETCVVIGGLVVTSRIDDLDKQVTRLENRPQLRGPKGDTGAVGAPGPRGFPGPPGEDAGDDPTVTDQRQTDRIDCIIRTLRLELDLLLCP